MDCVAVVVSSGSTVTVTTQPAPGLTGPAVHVSPVIVASWNREVSSPTDVMPTAPPTAATGMSTDSVRSAGSADGAVHAGPSIPGTA